jgi:hypothetical protein
MKNDLPTGACQHDIGFSISITLLSTSDDWWSEMKMSKHDTSPLEKAMDKATDLDDEAAG